MKLNHFQCTLSMQCYCQTSRLLFQSDLWQSAISRYTDPVCRNSFVLEANRCQEILLLRELMADFILLFSKSANRWKGNKLDDPLSQKPYCIDEITLRKNQIIQENVIYWYGRIQQWKRKQNKRLVISHEQTVIWFFIFVI